MKRALSSVQRAAARRIEADESYRAAVATARAHGHTLQQIGDAAGVSREAIRQTLLTTPKGGE